MHLTTLRHKVLPRLFLWAVSLLLVGCGEEKDTSIPEIIYHSPQFRQEFQVNDTVDVQATIHDSRAITHVKVNLTDKNFIPVSAVKTFQPNTLSYELNTRLWIDDITLQSGPYFVLVKAENGDQFKNKYQEIIIHGTEQEFRQLIVITEGGFNQFQIKGTGDFDLVQPLLTVTGDYAASAISPKDQLLFIAGKNNPNIHAYDLDDLSLSWMKEVTPGQPVHNDDCLIFDELLYATYNYNYIQGYNASGQLSFNVFTEESDAPERIFRQGDYVLVEMQKKNAIAPYIATYFAATGNEKQKRLISFDVVDFHSITKDVVAVVSNKDGQGSIYAYDATDDVLTFVHGFDENIRASVSTDKGVIILAGDLTTYAWYMETGQVAPILGDGALSVAYEHIMDLLILAGTQKIDVFKFPEMVNQKTLLFSDTILDMIIQYSE